MHRAITRKCHVDTRVLGNVASIDTTARGFREIPIEARLYEVSPPISGFDHFIAVKTYTKYPSPKRKKFKHISRTKQSEKRKKVIHSGIYVPSRLYCPSKRAWSLRLIAADSHGTPQEVSVYSTGTLTPRGHFILYWTSARYVGRMHKHLKTLFRNYK